MRIISQDRKYSIDFDSCTLHVSNTLVIVGANEERVNIGAYESSERAKEVFLDIHNAYSRTPVVFENVDIPEDLQIRINEWGMNCIIAKIPDNPPRIDSINNIVYYMPEK